MVCLVYLVYLVCLVCLVCLVYLDSEAFDSVEINQTDPSPPLLRD
jgi:hypothetical protein